MMELFQDISNKQPREQPVKTFERRRRQVCTVVLLHWLHLARLSDMRLTWTPCQCNKLEQLYQHAGCEP